MRFKPLAIATVIAGLFGIFAAGQAVRSERLESVQQSNGEVASILSSQVRADLEHLVRTLAEIGESKLKPLYQGALAEEGSGTEEATASDRFITREYEFDRDFLDVSLWGRPEGSPKPKRLYVALNNQYVTPAQSIMLRGQDTEAVEADLIQPAFSGQIVVTLGMPNEWGSFALMAIPMGQGTGVSDVVVAHIRLSRFQRVFRWDGTNRAVLVNGDGWVLAQSGHKLQEIRESLSSHPLVLAMRTDAGGSGEGTLDFVDSRGESHLGAYRRLNIGRLAVIAMIPLREALPFSRFTHGGAVAIGVLFGIALLFGYGAGRRGFARRVLASARKVIGASAGAIAEFRGQRSAEPKLIEPAVIREEPSLSSMDRLDSTAKRRVVTVLHGSVTQVSQLLEAQGAEVAVSALSDFFGLVASRVKEWGGEFEKEPGSSFVAVWGSDRSDGDWNALRCALELRSDFAHFNGIRKNDGEKPLVLGMGVDSGLALAGKIGPESGLSVIGEVLACARRLGQVGTSIGTDLLVSEDVWGLAGSRFIGLRSGEGKLSGGTGIRGYFSLSGYRDEQGLEVPVAGWKSPEGEALPFEAEALTNPGLVVQTPPEDRWLVNNGSQIVGPLTAREVAARLLVQELDFDCECWKENSGTPSSIAESGMFTGSEGEGASIWLHDGETIHGPLTEGFLRTALTRGALTEGSHACERSTVNGWKLVKDWLVMPEPAQTELVQASPIEAELTEPGSERAEDPEEDYLPSDSPDSDPWRSVA